MSAKRRLEEDGARADISGVFYARIFGCASIYSNFCLMTIPDYIMFSDAYGLATPPASTMRTKMLDTRTVKMA
jgi:hypothetical protein